VILIQHKRSPHTFGEWLRVIPRRFLTVKFTTGERSRKKLVELRLRLVRKQTVGRLRNGRGNQASGEDLREWTGSQTNTGLELSGTSKFMTQFDINIEENKKEAPFESDGHSPVSGIRLRSLWLYRFAGS